MLGVAVAAPGGGLPGGVAIVAVVQLLVVVVLVVASIAAGVTWRAARSRRANMTGCSTAPTSALQSAALRRWEVLRASRIAQVTAEPSATMQSDWVFWWVAASDCGLPQALPSNAATS